MVALNMMSEHTLIHKWRYAHATIDEDIIFIRQHLNTLAESKAERKGTSVIRYHQRYVDYCRRRLAERLKSYLTLVQTITNVEQEMTTRAINFQRP